MTGKRALIVDDSKSARVVLSRLLERHEIAVDATESAESALVYLQEHRPDVIFMDHVMSGMDGLSAVQLIKKDPSFASIPIMMYTSQDGEVYAGEARASGAAGVLQKLLGPSDVAKVLYDLELLPVGAAARGSDFGQVQLPAGGVVAVEAPVPGVDATPAAPAAVAATESAAPSAPPPPPLTRADVTELIEPLLRDQGADLRRFVVASLESFSGRVVTELAGELRGAVTTAAGAAREAATAAAAAAAAAERPPPVVPPPRAWIAASAVAALIAAAAMAFAWQQHRELTEVEGRAAAMRRDLVARPAPAVPAAPVAAPDRIAVPYGEVPLSVARLTALQTLLAGLEQRGFAGTVRVTTFRGDFCLTGNPTEGYGLAPGEMPANRCDLVGNPADEALRGQHTPAAFTALANETHERSHGAIDLVAIVAAQAPVATGTYPSGSDVSAAQWNDAAAAQNRIEISVEPRPADR